MARGIKMLKAWRQWRETTNLSNGLFLKMYIYDRVLIRPKRRIRKFMR